MRVLLALLLMTSVCYASDLYVVIKNNEPQGTVTAKGKILKEWKKDATLISVGEEYRGKQPYEMKYINGELRLATKEEIQAYKDQQESEAQNRERIRLLSLLGLNETDIENIKKLK